MLDNEQYTVDSYPVFLPEESGFLRFLYGTVPGRMLLQPLTAPPITRALGHFMDTPLSSHIIAPFKRMCHISLDDYEEAEYRTFNDFFTRKIRSSARPIDYAPQNLISPCDSKLSVYEISAESTFKIKHSLYSVETLLASSRLASRFAGGYCCIFRLSVDDYHRYHYIDEGVRTRYVRIPGELHTVMPIALEYEQIYHRNTREYAVMRTKNFGNVLMMQVGAMLVGRIRNRDERRFRRGDEAGCFDYGGSTVVLLFERDQILPRKELLTRTLEGYETIVKMGQVIGRKKDTHS